MKFVFVLTFIALSVAQGFFPPGLQFNPFFNPQQNQAAPPGLQFNPYFNQNLRNYSSGPYYPPPPPRYNFSSFGGNIFGRNPYFSSFYYPRSADAQEASAFKARGLLGGYSFYNPYLGCISNTYQTCNGSHSLYLGCLQPHHRVLYRQSYVKPGRWYSKRVKTINYPGDLPPGFIRNDTITAIHIIDRNCNGTGGYAQVLPGGGVGYRWATIRLYSTAANKGFNFYVQLFGY